MDATGDLADRDRRARCANLWFEDGNVTLATNSMLFRVHRGVLSLNSPVFADMFALPQPADSTESIDGAPVVYITGDDGEEMCNLLRAIYDRT